MAWKMWLWLILLPGAHVNLKLCQCFVLQVDFFFFNFFCSQDLMLSLKDVKPGLSVVGLKLNFSLCLLLLLSCRTCSIQPGSGTSLQPGQGSARILGSYSLFLLPVSPDDCEGQFSTEVKEKHRGRKGTPLFLMLSGARAWDVTVKLL